MGIDNMNQFILGCICILVGLLSLLYCARGYTGKLVNAINRVVSIIWFRNQFVEMWVVVIMGWLSTLINSYTQSHMWSWLLFGIMWSVFVCCIWWYATSCTYGEWLKTINIRLVAVDSKHKVQWKSPDDLSWTTCFKDISINKAHEHYTDIEKRLKSHLYHNPLYVIRTRFREAP